MLPSKKIVLGILNNEGDSRKFPWVKALDTKAVDLSLISRPHTVVGETIMVHVIYQPPQVHCDP